MQIKITMTNHCTPTSQKPEHWKHQMLVWMWRNRITHSLLVGMQNSVTTLEDILAVSYKAQHSLTVWSSNRIPWYLPKSAENLCLQKTGIAILIATLFVTGKTWKQQICLSVSEWINKLWKIHALEYYSAIERNELSNHERTWGKFKYILLSKEPIWKGYSMLPGIQHSGKGKTKKIIKRWVFTRGWGEKGMNKHSIGSF